MSEKGRGSVAAKRSGGGRRKVLIFDGEIMGIIKVILLGRL